MFSQNVISLWEESEDPNNLGEDPQEEHCPAQQRADLRVT